MAVLIQATIMVVGLVLTPPSTMRVEGTVLRAPIGREVVDVAGKSGQYQQEQTPPNAGVGQTTIVEPQSGTTSDGTLSEPAHAPSATTESAQSTRWQTLSPPYHAPSALPVHGRAMYYNPGIMERVLEYRMQTGRVQPCDECIGFAAMIRYGDLGRKVWIQLADSTVEGPFLVIDAADVKHVYALLERNWVIDVDYATAMRWKMAGPHVVTVLDSPPPPPRQDVLAADLLPPVQPYTTDIYRRSKMKHTSSMNQYLEEIEGLYVH